MPVTILHIFLMMQHNVSTFVTAEETYFQGIFTSQPKCPLEKKKAHFCFLWQHWIKLAHLHEAALYLSAQASSVRVRRNSVCITFCSHEAKLQLSLLPGWALLGSKASALLLRCYNVLLYPLFHAQLWLSHHLWNVFPTYFCVFQELKFCFPAWQIAGKIKVVWAACVFPAL